MKPFGRDRNLKGGESKRDNHPRGGDKNWWEDIQNLTPRTTMKEKWKKETECECENCEEKDLRFMVCVDCNKRHDEL